MKKISNLWERINHLVPEPQCQTRDNKIIEWTDDRPQPTEEELRAVDVNAIESAQRLERKQVIDSFISLSGMSVSELESYIATHGVPAVIKIILARLNL